MKRWTHTCSHSQKPGTEEGRLWLKCLSGARTPWSRHISQHAIPMVIFIYLVIMHSDSISPSLSLLYLIFFKSFPFAISSFEFIRHLKLLVRIHFKIWFIFSFFARLSLYICLPYVFLSLSKMIDELWKELNPFFVPALTPIRSFWLWHYDAFSNARTICDL